MGSPVHGGKTARLRPRQGRSNQLLPGARVEGCERFAPLPGGGIEVAQLPGPAKRWAGTGPPDLSRAVVVKKLGAFPIAGNPAFEAGNRPFDPRRAELGGQDDPAEVTQEAGIEVPHRQTVKPPGDNRQGEEAGKPKDKTSAR